jgi:hypothetical protein
MIVLDLLPGNVAEVVLITVAVLSRGRHGLKAIFLSILAPAPFYLQGEIPICLNFVTSRNVVWARFKPTGAGAGFGTAQGA